MSEFNFVFVPSIKGRYAEYIQIAIDVMGNMRARWVPNIRTRYKTSTGNMAFNSLRYKIKQNEITFYIDEAIAPYVVYTNEPWLSPHWKGKKNPNEGWFQRLATEFIRRFEMAVKRREDLFYGG